jgi:DNA (cytosine-5)-methyltransferase 1
MWDVPRFAEWHDYEICIVENVPDARKWRLWDAWIKAMSDLGYDYQPLYLNSQHFHPCPQSRNRMYVVFWKEGNDRPDLDFRPPAWCEDCHENVRSVQSWRDTDYGRKRIGLRYGVQYEYRCPHCSKVVEPYYYAAFNVIDWTIDAPKIGERDRPLAERTMERIEHGLDEYGRDPLVITTRYTSGVDCRVRNGKEEAMPTQPGDNSHAVCEPPASAALVAPFLQKQNGGAQRPWSLTDPIGAQTTSLSDGLVGLPPQVVSVNDFDSRTLEATSEAYPTQTTQTKWAVLRPPTFLAELHGTSDAKSLTGPLGCVLAGGNHHALVETEAFVSYYYSSGHQNSGIDDPIQTVTAKDKAALVKTAEEEAANVDVEDCTFRMLKPHEIQRAMAFPDDYEVFGTKREQVRQLGNAVTPPVARDIVDRCIESLDRG